jgi:hypothetical protein
MTRAAECGYGHIKGPTHNERGEECGYGQTGHLLVQAAVILPV